MATEAQPAKQAKLLVVEDDVLVRMLLADIAVYISVVIERANASLTSGHLPPIFLLLPLQRRASRVLRR